MIAKPLFCLLALCLSASSPDEGQWLPIQVRNMDWAKLKERGMELTKDEFWHPTKGGVLSAAIHFNDGCTASFVSDKGLVVTNHHCGFGAVQKLSSVELNYVRDGFVCGSMSEELATGLTVSVLREIEDVTEQVHEAQAKAKSPIERVSITRRVTEQIRRQGEASRANTKCLVASFFEGREYHLYYRTVIRDVRLVYAPPRSVGEYGGEVDNWEWPRHTGDFSFFRAYVAPDGKSRPYNEANVPFEPKHYLGVSQKGVQADDLVMILGYPGRTERYLTARAVADRQGIYFPLRHELFKNIIHRIEAACDGDEAKTLAYSSRVKSLANVQKNALGMIKGLARNATVQLKEQQEELFVDWVKSDAERQAKYGDVLKNLRELDARAQANTLRDLMFVTLMSPRTASGHFRMLINMARSMMMQTGEELRYSERLLADIKRGADKDLMNLQAPLLAYLIDEARRLPEDQQLRGFAKFPVGEHGTLAAVRKALKESALTKKEGRLEFLDLGPDGLKDTKDPLVKLALGMAGEWINYIRRHQAMDGARMESGRLWIEAQQKWRGQSFYPDANSTLRVAIANVKGYSPRDGIWYPPHTTVAGILEKDTGKEPFNVPDSLKRAAKNRKSSQYFDKKIGDVPVCFLADGDTTGGNSGSPVINGRGELVGLNFDRAFESVSGDYGWNKSRSRNISVDVRYVLWFLEQVVPATHLLDEMKTATKKLGR